MSERKKHFMQEEVLLDIPPKERDDFVKFLELYYQQLVVMGALLKDVPWFHLSYEGRRRIVMTGKKLWKNVNRGENLV